MHKVLLVLISCNTVQAGTDTLGNLSFQMSSLRSRSVEVESQLIRGIHQKTDTQSTLKKIQELISLQNSERALGTRRRQELEKTVSELNIRKGKLLESVVIQQRSIYRSLKDLHSSLREQANTSASYANESIEAPRRRVISLLIDQNVKEVEALRVDLADADQLREKISQEQAHLVYLEHDLVEQQSLLELNRKMQVDFIKRRQQKRIVQLEGYRALKGTEAQVDKLLGEFNARKELERNIQIERESRVSFSGGAFPRLKGRLPSPLVGRVLTKFGQVYDEATKLQIFKKGIEIATTVGKKIPVTAIFSGKIAFSGELPFYGRVAIIDHGDHYYSLCGHLGEISRKTGDKVSVGESIGYTDPSGSPLYFEIRSHNIAVNPLQWVSN